MHRANTTPPQDPLPNGHGIEQSDRDPRQRDTLPPDALAGSRCTVIGVGAIGRQVALQLAAIGVPWLQLIDFDTVEAVNLAPQGYLQDDLGRPKVQATADLCQQINPRLETHTIHDRYRRSTPIGESVFACVDRIEVRRVIFESVQTHAGFFCDGRMSAEVVRVLACNTQADWSYYPRTLFAADQAFRGSCTAQSTIFTANIAAGLMLEQFSRHLRRMPLDLDLQLNLLASELVPITA